MEKTAKELLLMYIDDDDPFFFYDEETWQNLYQEKPNLDNYINNKLINLIV